MDITNVLVLRPMVTQTYLMWRYLRRLPGAVLWWMWLTTIVVHLLLLVGGVGIYRGEEARETGYPVVGAMSILESRIEDGGWLIIVVLVLSPGRYAVFPWQQYRAKWRIRRRRIADMSFEELLALLPSGVRTIAQMVDVLTRSQMAKLLCAIPVIYPILTELEIEKIIDQYCPTEAEINIGAVIAILCLNRLVAPVALSRVSEWAAKTVIEEYTGVPASKLNDDRLGRALDKIYPHIDVIWGEIAAQALIRYEIDLSLVFYDLTTFYFEGEYKKSKSIVMGYNRTHKGKKQRKIALNVTAREKFPFLYQLLDGNTADVDTVQENMERLLSVLQKRGWPMKRVMVVGDRAMLSAEIVRGYHRANLKYLGALKVKGKKEKDLIRGVSEEDLQAHPLDENHYGVERPYTFKTKETEEEEGWEKTDRAVVVLNPELRHQKRKRRAEHIWERIATLNIIASKRLNQRKYKRRAYAQNQIEKQVLNRPGGKFITVVLDGEDGDLRMSWSIDGKALREAIVLDGKFILVTNDPYITSAKMRNRYGEKDKVEKDFRTVKGPIRLRPIFLHKEERIASLVFVNMLALMVYSVMEMKCQRAGLMITGEEVLRRFAYLAVIFTTFVDGSIQVQIERLDHRQQEVVQAIRNVEWLPGLGSSLPVLPEPPLERYTMLEKKIPLPMLA